MIWDLIAATANEGLHAEMLRRFMPKTASREMDDLLARFGVEIYREAIWDDRKKAATPVPDRARIDWPIRKVTAKVLPFKIKTQGTIIPDGFWCP